MKGATRRALSLAARTAVVVAAFWFVARGANGQVVASTLRRARVWPLLGVVGLNALVMGLRAVRLRLLLHRAAGLRSCWLAKLTASAMNNVIPLRGGDMARLWMLQRHARISKTGAAAIAVVEGLFDLATLSGLALAAAALLGTQRWVMAVALVLGVGATVLIAVCRRLAAHPRPASDRSGRISRFVRRLAARVQPGVRGLSQPGVIVWATVTSLLSWVLEAGMVVLCARAVHLPIGGALAAVVLLAINVAMAVPSSPAGAGPFESAVVAVLMLAGIGKSPAVAFALLYHLVQVVPVTLAGALVVWRAGVTLDRLPAGSAEAAPDQPAGQPTTSAIARPSHPFRPTV